MPRLVNLPLTSSNDGDGGGPEAITAAVGGAGEYGDGEPSAPAPVAPGIRGVGVATTTPPVVGMLGPGTVGGVGILRSGEASRMGGVRLVSITVPGGFCGEVIGGMTPSVGAGVPRVPTAGVPRLPPLAVLVPGFTPAGGPPKNGSGCGLRSS